MAGGQQLTTLEVPGAITYNALKTKKMQAVWDWPTTGD
jgi:hypothetical protein